MHLLEYVQEPAASCFGCACATSTHIAVHCWLRMRALVRHANAPASARQCAQHEPGPLASPIGICHSTHSWTTVTGRLCRLHISRGLTCGHQTRSQGQTCASCCPLQPLMHVLAAGSSSRSHGNVTTIHTIWSGDSALAWASWCARVRRCSRGSVSFLYPTLS